MDEFAKNTSRLSGNWNVFEASESARDIHRPKWHITLEHRKAGD